MISSILKSDFISTRLIVQGISLKKGKNINLLILIDVKCLQGRIFQMLAFCLEGQYIRLPDLEIWL